tara:strand:- start:19761 stop:20066 length:306 start_codon:yes stop_codon:yes gene_type:complete
MKTQLFIAAVFISTVTFSQTTEKKSNFPESNKENATQHMSKAELIDAVAKGPSTSNQNTKKNQTVKSYGSTRSNKQTIRTNHENPLYKAKNEEKSNPLYNE